MYEESKKCRICMQDVRREIMSITNLIAIGDGNTYSDIYKSVSGFCPEKGSQHLCKSCSEDLLGSYEFKKKIEQCEEFWKIEIKLEDEMGDIVKSPEEIEIKPDTDDLLFVSTLMNEEPSTSGKDYLKVEEENDEFGFCWSDRDCNSSESETDSNGTEKQKKNTEKCPYCQGMYKNRKVLLKHCRKKHSGKRMSCGECDLKFVLPYQLKKHRRSHHTDSDIDDSLDKIKSSKTRSPKLDEIFECPFCPETFPVKHRLTIHKKEQHKGQRLPKKDMNEKTICPHCGLILFAKSLDKHTRQVHNKNPDEMYICDLCGAKVTSRNGIISHMQLKHLNVAYICRHCPEVFQNPGTRRTHEIRFHTLKYNFSCHICAKKFLTGVYLRKHLNSHTGERKHTCEICGMALATKESLKHHMATHSGILKFL